MSDGVLIAVPHINTVHAGLAAVLCQIARTHQGELGIFFSKDIPHDSNRNKIVREFLKTSHEWLLMIDSDMVPPLNILEMRKNGKKICSANVSANRDGIRVPLALYMGEDGIYEYDPSRMIGTVQKVDAIGTGCILIHRTVLEKMKPPYFKFHYSDEGIMNKGEDMDFCERAREVGEEVWFDPGFVCRHFTSQVV